MFHKIGFSFFYFPYFASKLEDENVLNYNFVCSFVWIRDCALSHPFPPPSGSLQT